MTTPRQRLAQARVNTFTFVPYLSSYIYALVPHETREVDTACVDAKGRLYYNPEFITQVSLDTGAYIVAHEALHLIFEHHKRASLLVGEQRTEQQQLVLNIAADLVVEQTLAAANMRRWRPPGAVCIGAEVPQLGGMYLFFPDNLSMEDYYRLIMDKLREQQEQKQNDSTNHKEDDSDGDSDDDGDSAGSDGSNSDDQDADGSGDSQGGEADAAGGGADSPPTGQGKAPAMPGQIGGGGSCADGSARPYEVEDDGSWDTYGSDFAAASMEKAISDYEQTGRGTVPGSVKQAVASKLRPQPDPFDQLRSAVCTSVAAPVGGRDFSHRRLSRKQPADDDAPLLHGRICVQPRAVVIVDTSGSMMDKEAQAKALSVIGQGLRKLGRVKVICADTAVRSHKSVATTRAFEWTGGGGTDMARAIEDVERSDKPDSIILITDAITRWPASKPRARVVVAYTGQRDSRYHTAIPTWARTVVLSQ